MFQIYSSMNKIIEETSSHGSLWLGDFSSAQDYLNLRTKGIKTVLTVASGLNIQYPSSAEISHKVYPIYDSENANITRLFPETYNDIQEGLKRGSVLVHCAAGVSRSASIVIGYIMKSKNLSLEEAFDFVKKRRGVIFPNFGFQRQLRMYEKEIKIRNLNVSSSTFYAKSTEKKKEPQESQTIKDLSQSAFYKNRSNSTQPKNLYTTTYGASYGGPQIVTYNHKSQLGDAQFRPKNYYNIPGIQQRQGGGMYNNIYKN